METFEKLKQEYTPIIREIIDSNSKFYQFKQHIDFEFFCHEDIGVIAQCSNKHFSVKINLIALNHIKKINTPLTLEFYILHEIRHLYQHIYKCVSNSPKAEQWAFEFSHYINMYQSKQGYYSQSIEFDAFAFSYAIMLYKYGKIEYISSPSFYDNNDLFSKAVNRWIEYFKQNNL